MPYWTLYVLHIYLVTILLFISHFFAFACSYLELKKILNYNTSKGVLLVLAYTRIKNEIKNIIQVKILY